MAKNPLELPLNRKFTSAELIEALRIAIIAELDAVNLYLQFARACSDEKAKRVFEGIAKEEKTHVGEFLALLRRLDTEQELQLKAGEKEVEEMV
ncbi:MAG: ferritin family protein [Candidatus Nezhaarchaeota archaeon]|nr:ferritin family protein [Candidatus Nezhaarchaeota archaeon]